MADEAKFTEDWIKGLAVPADGRNEYRDTATAGLYLRVTSTGNKSFSFVGRTKGAGKTERVTIGKWPAVKVKEAQARALALSAGMAAGNSAATANRARRQELTLGELFNLYQAASKARRPEKTADVWRLYVEPAFGLRKLSEIDHLKVSAWHRKLPQAIAKRRAAKRALVGATAAPVTGHRVANQALALVHALYRWAIEKARLFAGDNPAHGIDRFPELERERFITKGELAPFFTALLAYPNPTMRCVFFTALMTGARRSNVLCMRWADVDLDAASWRIGQTKNGTPQTVTLAPDLVEMLREMLPNDTTTDPWVFPSSASKSGHLVEPKGAWRSILKTAGLSDLRIHDLRRTLGSWQAGAGASLSVIGKSLNHKSHASTAIYARLDLDPVRQSVERAAAAMLEAGGLREGGQVLPFKAA